MYRTLVLAPIAALVLSACVVTPAGYGGVAVAPALPVVVELDVEPYYYQSGYYYFYDNQRWRYARSRSGPWADLPRSHYPRETRFKGRGAGRDDDHRDGRRRDRDHDRRDGRGGGWDDDRYDRR